MLNPKINVANSLKDLEEFLTSTISSSGFALDKVALGDQIDWLVVDGALSHSSRGFFSVCGIKNSHSHEEKLALYQPQGALTGLILCKKNSKIYLLLQARVEPGNTGIGQYGPTIQSTPANYLQFHGGKKTAYVDRFITYSCDTSPLYTSMQLDIGQHYFQKSKAHAYLEVSELSDTEENMIWACQEVIGAALVLDNFLNADLRSLLSAFDWDAYAGVEQPHCCSNSSLFFSMLLTGKLNELGIWKPIPLHQLNRWKFDKYGLVDSWDVGISVGLYRTTCIGREVRSWIQPLMLCRGRGLAALYLRQRGLGFEFLISVMTESGIGTGYAAFPSLLIYPKESIFHAPQGKVLAQFTQSDEGGRFYQHESVYQLALIEGEMEISANQFWISYSDLKKVLRTSNLASFQLRCVASLCIETLKPDIFLSKSDA